LNKEEIIEGILGTTPFVRSNFRILQKLDPNDHYWRIFDEPEKFTVNGVMIETAMAVSWIGKTFQPRRILEIGTRTGGSLISLLSNYRDFKGVEVVSFDLWREYASTTYMSSVYSRYKNRKSETFQGNINVSEKKLKLFKGFIRNLSIKKVKRNFNFFNIPTDILCFVSGDSKLTVPEYFEQYPEQAFDYILVDGAHDEESAITDLRNVADHVSPGGIIGFDDISERSYNLINVWNQFKAEQQDNFNFIEIDCRKGFAFAFKK
jgi:predicted O-methyltransferase YrrM